jgi:hypothetical protein
MAEVCANGHSSVFARWSHPSLSFEDPVWTSGSIAAGVNVKVITSAITQLAGALNAEIEARVALEARVVEVAATTARADSASRQATSSADDEASSDDCAAGGTRSGSAGGTALGQMKRDIARLESDFAYAKAQQDQRARAADDKLRLQLDALRRDLELRVHSDLVQQREAILSETHGFAQAAIDAEVKRLQTSLENVHSTGEERYRLLDGRLDTIVDDFRTTASALDALAARGALNLSLRSKSPASCRAFTSVDAEDDFGAASPHSGRTTASGVASVGSICATATDDAGGCSRLESRQESRLESRSNSPVDDVKGHASEELALGEALNSFKDEARQGNDEGIVAWAQQHFDALRTELDAVTEAMARHFDFRNPSKGLDTEERRSDVDRKHAELDSLQQKLFTELDRRFGELANGYVCSTDAGALISATSADVGVSVSAVDVVAAPTAQSILQNDQAVASMPKEAVNMEFAGWVESRLASLRLELLRSVNAARDTQPTEEASQLPSLDAIPDKAALGKLERVNVSGGASELAPQGVLARAHEQDSALDGAAILAQLKLDIAVAVSGLKAEFHGELENRLSAISTDGLQRSVTAVMQPTMMQHELCASAEEKSVAILQGIVYGLQAQLVALRSEMDALHAGSKVPSSTCDTSSKCDAASESAATLERIVSGLQAQLVALRSEVHALQVGNNVAQPPPKCDTASPSRERINRLEARLANAENIRAVDDSSNSLRVDLDALMKRLAHLERSWARPSSANNTSNGEDIANFQKALRGVQKEAEMNTSRLKDLDTTVAALRGRLEVIWPIVGMSLHGGAASGAMIKTGEVLSSGSGETPDLLAAPQVESLFASRDAHDALRRDVLSIDDGMQGRFKDLRDEMMGLLKSKANASDLQAMAHRQRGLEVRSSLAQQAGDMRYNDGTCTETPSLTKVPLLPARCISCDRKVDVAACRPNPWQAGGMPGPAWPQREPACPTHSAAGPPPGYRQRREISLPPVVKET